MLVAFLSIYAVALTLYLLQLHRTRNRETELDRIWKDVTQKPNLTTEDLKAIAEVAKVRQTALPWYERSVSTIGIVAFFSMLIATSLQSINSANTEIESSNVRQEIKALEAQRDVWKQLVKSLSEVIVLKQLNSGKIEESERDILRQRVKDLEQAETGKPETDSERLKIYLALQQFDNASAIVEKSSALAESTLPETLLLLAENSFLDGAKSRTKLLLSKFEPNISKQPLEWQVRFFVIKAALEPSPEVYTKEVAAIRGMDLKEAQELLIARVEQLKQNAKRRALTANTAETSPASKPQ